MTKANKQHTDKREKINETRTEVRNNKAVLESEEQIVTTVLTDLTNLHIPLPKRRNIAKCSFSAGVNIGCLSAAFPHTIDNRFDLSGEDDFKEAYSAHF